MKASGTRRRLCELSWAQIKCSVIASLERPKSIIKEYMFYIRS